MIRRAIDCGFRRIEFRVDRRNARSQAAMAKLGAVREGVIRAERITWTGHVRDTVLFSILAGEWSDRDRDLTISDLPGRDLADPARSSRSCCHEISHGWVAARVRRPHRAAAGAAEPQSAPPCRSDRDDLLPLVLAVAGAPVFGWAKPVPVVAQRMRQPRLHMMLVALAGPGMNLLLAFAGGRPGAADRSRPADGGLGWLLRAR